MSLHELREDEWRGLVPVADWANVAATVQQLLDCGVLEPVEPPDEPGEWRLMWVEGFAADSRYLPPWMREVTE